MMSSPHLVREVYVHPTGDLVFATNFISAEEEASLLRCLYGPDFQNMGRNTEASVASPSPSLTSTSPPPRLPWVQLSRRRLLNLGGVPGSNERMMVPLSTTPMLGGVPFPPSTSITDADLPTASSAASSISSTCISSISMASLNKTPPMVPELIPPWALDVIGGRLLRISDAAMRKGEENGKKSDKSLDVSDDGGNGCSAAPLRATVPSNDDAAFAACLADAIYHTTAAAANSFKEDATPPSSGPSAPSSPSSASSHPLPYRLVASSINHILVNEYLGANGIMGHEDGPVYEPIVSIVSLEGSVMLRFESKAWRRERGERKALRKRRAVAAGAPQQGEQNESNSAIAAIANDVGKVAADDDDDDDDPTPPPNAVIEVCLPPRSLVVFRGRFYTEYLHSVPECEADVFSKANCFNYPVAEAEAANTRSTETATREEESSSTQRVTIHRAPRRVSFTYRRALNVAKVSAASLFGRRR